MPITGYLAMALGIVFSLVVGCGLMALLFYSSRHGYDDQTGCLTTRIERPTCANAFSRSRGASLYAVGCGAVHGTNRIGTASSG